MQDHDDAMDQEGAAAGQPVAQPPQQGQDPQLALDVGVNPPGGADLVRIFLEEEGPEKCWLMGMPQREKPLGELPLRNGSGKLRRLMAAASVLMSQALGLHSIKKLT